MIDRLYRWLLGRFARRLARCSPELQGTIAELATKSNADLEEVLERERKRREYGWARRAGEGR